jgi:transaldolase
MRDSSYLRWMAEGTPTQWCNDSALPGDYKDAMRCGAIGCTTNPPLTYQAIAEHPELYKGKVEGIKARFPAAADRAVEYLGIVVRSIAADFKGLHAASGGKLGYVRSQVEPRLGGDEAAMLAMGRKIAAFGENVMVKVPGTAAGLRAYEELTAAGVPTTATVCLSLPQAIAAAEAYERGCARAAAAGIAAPQSTVAIVMGRLQDYLAVLNEERGSPLALADLEIASLAVVKRAYSVFKERGHGLTIMPAAFRCAAQVTQLVGGDFHMTIHPKIQDLIIEQDRRDPIKRESPIDRPVDGGAIERVMKLLPEYRMAYEPEGMTADQFGDFGATKMTLDGFDKTGWQKLLAL